MCFGIESAEEAAGFFGENKGDILLLGTTAWFALDIILVLFLTCYSRSSLGRPRGRSDDSIPNRVAVRFAHR